MLNEPMAYKFMVVMALIKKGNEYIDIKKKAQLIRYLLDPEFGSPAGWWQVGRPCREKGVPQGEQAAHSPSPRLNLLTSLSERGANLGPLEEFPCVPPLIKPGQAFGAALEKGPSRQQEHLRQDQRSFA
jgi:hypothetical protein